MFNRESQRRFPFRFVLTFSTVNILMVYMLGRLDTHSNINKIHPVNQIQMLLRCTYFTHGHTDGQTLSQGPHSTFQGAKEV